MSLDNIAKEKKELEEAKQKFFQLVDDFQYKKAVEYFSQLDAEKRNYVKNDKMGEARLKELRYKGYGHI